MSIPIRFIVGTCVIILTVILLDVFGFYNVSSKLEMCLVPAITVLYLLKSINKSKRLSLFLILYSIGDFVNIFLYNPDDNFYYYLCNIIYISAYTFLVLYVIKSLSFKLVFKNHLIDFIVLLLLDLYMLYVLINIVKPIDFDSKYVSAIQIVEFFYSFILIVLFSVSFLNYVQNTIKKYLLLFISCLLIAFSELILIGYYFIVDDVRLSYVSVLFFVSGICMLYYHTFLKNTSKIKVN